ncbi:hypothetical protein QJQ45_001344 [Haematococcus lacustris]|nr:hypothetical protein QJQ45_001344 [Haematococcus lacustris]
MNAQFPSPVPRCQRQCITTLRSSTLGPHRQLLVPRQAATHMHTSSYTCPYSVLGVPVGAEEADVKKAYRQLAKTLHPDICKEEGASQRFLTITQAYEFLMSLAHGKDMGDLLASCQRRGNSAAFHDWFWAFRMSRTWDKQHHSEAAADSAAQQFAAAQGPPGWAGAAPRPQAQDAEVLRTQLAGLRHRAALRRHRPCGSASASGCGGGASEPRAHPAPHTARSSSTSTSTSNARYGEPGTGFPPEGAEGMPGAVGSFLEDSSGWYVLAEGPADSADPEPAPATVPPSPLHSTAGSGSTQQQTWGSEPAPAAASQAAAAPTASSTVAAAPACNTALSPVAPDSMVSQGPLQPAESSPQAPEAHQPPPAAHPPGAGCSAAASRPEPDWQHHLMRHHWAALPPLDTTPAAHPPPPASPSPPSPAWPPQPPAPAVHQGQAVTKLQASLSNILPHRTPELSRGEGAGQHASRVPTPLAPPLAHHAAKSSTAGQLQSHAIDLERCGPQGNAVPAPGMSDQQRQQEQQHDLVSWHGSEAAGAGSGAEAEADPPPHLPRRRPFVATGEAREAVREQLAGMRRKAQLKQQMMQAILQAS